jgi:hypothetical protein
MQVYQISIDHSESSPGLILELIGVKNRFSLGKFRIRLQRAF